MPERAVTTGQILSWAREVASSFVNKGVDMEKSAMKIARDNGLNEEQLSRVCQATNHEVYKAKSQHNPNDLLEFPVLKAEAVIEALEQPVTKTAAYVDDSDYYDPPPSPLTISCDEVFDRMFPKTAAEQERQSEATEMKKTADMRLEINKLSAAEGEMRSQVVGADMKREEEEEAFYHTVKNMLLEGKTFEEVYENLMLDEDGMGDEKPSSMSIRSLTERIMDRLKAENLIDQAEELPKDTPKMHSVKNITMEPDYKVASDRFTTLVCREANLQVLRHALGGLSEELQDKQAAYMEHIKKESDG